MSLRHTYRQLLFPVFILAEVLGLACAVYLQVLAFPCLVIVTAGKVLEKGVLALRTPKMWIRTPALMWDIACTIVGMGILFVCLPFRSLASNLAGLARAILQGLVGYLPDRGWYMGGTWHDPKPVQQNGGVA